MHLVIFLTHWPGGGGFMSHFMCGLQQFFEVEGGVAYKWPWLGPFWNGRQHGSVMQIPLWRCGPQFCVCQVLCNVSGLEARAMWVWCACGSPVHVDWLVFLGCFLWRCFMVIGFWVEVFFVGCWDALENEHTCSSLKYVEAFVTIAVGAWTLAWDCWWILRRFVEDHCLVRLCSIERGCVWLISISKW